jgi:hypothetical protein
MAHEHYSTRKHPEFVVLEIGDELGALIVHTDADMHGVEIESSHKEVLERVTGGRSAYTAVFDQLAAGTYTLWMDGVARIRGVTVRGGGVAQLRWPAHVLAGG